MSPSPTCCCRNPDRASLSGHSGNPGLCILEKAGPHDFAYFGVIDSTTKIRVLLAPPLIADLIVKAFPLAITVTGVPLGIEKRMLLFSFGTNTLV